MKYVYMLKAGENHYKVGVSTNVTKRLKTLQTSNPTKIELVMCKLVDDAYRVEQGAHHYLHEMKGEGGREWFLLTPEQAISLAIDINKYPEIDMTQQITVRDILSKQSANQNKIEGLLQDFIEAHPEFIPPKPVEVERIVYKQAAPKMTAQDKQLVEEGLVKSALEVFREEGRASTSLLQRRLRIGYGRAASIMDKLEYRGLVTESDGIHGRQLVSS